MNHCWPVGKSCLIMFPTEGVSWFLKKRSMEEKVCLKARGGGIVSQNCDLDHNSLCFCCIAPGV